MSSGLLSYASPYENGNKNNNTIRKRISTLPNASSNRNNKTVKKTPTEVEDTSDEYPVDRENFQSLTPYSLDDSNDRSVKVKEIINSIVSIKTEDDGTSLANFNPISTSASPSEKPIIKSVAPSFATNDAYLGNSFGSYKDIYTSSSHIGDIPYYNKISPEISVVPNDKYNEKINYIIHLLEEQQHEPTKHITEELILYMFLGIFVIYIVDSFARVGKYIR
jgi:hypothetical protein